MAPLGDITIFVDPLDGTREFVEGRVWNVQVLVGIAVCGEATAGAVGLPFASGSSDSDAAVVYGMVSTGLGLGYPDPNLNPADPNLNPADPKLNPADPNLNPADPKLNPADPNLNPDPNPNQVGAGSPRVYGARAPGADPVHGGGTPGEGAQPLLVTGDDADGALTAAYAAALSAGGRRVLLGGTGQKCLAVAEGRADAAVTNP